MIRIVAAAVALTIVVGLVMVGAIGIHYFNETADSLFNEGFQAYQSGDLKTAITDFRKSVRLDPDNVATYCNLGRAYIGQGDFDSAIESLDAAVKIDPKWAEAYCYRGLAREGKDDYKGALEDFNESIKLDSHNPEAYRNRAFLFYMAGKYQNCTESLTDILNSGQLSGDDLDSAWFFFYLARTRNGDADAANQDLTRYLRGRNGDADFNGRIGQFLIGKLTEADLYDAANSEDAHKAQEQLVSAQFYVASVKLIKKDLDGARVLFNKILDSNCTYMPEYQTTKVTMKEK